MPWNYETIAREWLGDSPIAVPRDGVVAAFECCSNLFGDDWIINYRRSVPGLGAPHTLRIVTLGQRLASLNGVANVAPLIEKIVNGDQSAESELQAIHILRSFGDTEVELFPRIQVDGRERVPDFRIRRANGSWIYVEVTQTDVSEAHQRASAVIERIVATTALLLNQFDLEVFLRREPTDLEIIGSLSSIASFCAQTEVRRAELSNGLGLLIHKGDPARPIVIDDHGEANVPRLAQARIRIENGVPIQRVAVRMPYSDERAEKLIHRESAQLPIDGPGMIMVEMSGAPGGFKSWDLLVRRRFQPNVNTRIGAVALFGSGVTLIDGGFVTLVETKALTNLHARTPLPDWIESALAAAGAQYDAVLRRNPAGPLMEKR